MNLLDIKHPAGQRTEQNGNGGGKVGCAHAQVVRDSVDFGGRES